MEIVIFIFIAWLVLKFTGLERSIIYWITGDDVEVSWPMHVYQMNDCDWYIAPSAEDAIREYLADIGDDEPVEPLKLNAKQLRKLTFFEDDGYTTRSFYRELKRRIRRGDQAGVFASTEF